jgi:hypothetical protein
MMEWQELVGKKVDVYWNLHRKVWSVRHRGKVVAHLDKVALRDVEWVVQPAGNRRAREEQRKNVHAFARGRVIPQEVGWVALRTHCCWRVTYNPFQHESFVLHYDGETKVHASKQAWMTIDTDGPTAIATHIIRR